MTTYAYIGLNQFWNLLIGLLALLRSELLYLLFAQYLFLLLCTIHYFAREIGPTIEIGAAEVLRVYETGIISFNVLFVCPV
jgi:hypothetical protein